MTSSKESLERLNNTIIEQLQRAHKAQIESLETELAELREALEYYSNPAIYYPEYSDDQFVEADETVAREALQKIRGDKK